MKTGFTILELLLVVFLISSLLLVGIPFWQNVDEQLLLNKEQQKVVLFLRQIQARAENLQEPLWLFTNRNLSEKRWCFSVQTKHDILCDCLKPHLCPKSVDAQFYYPHANGKTMISTPKYFPERTTAFNGARNTVFSTCFVLQVADLKTFFSLYMVGSIRLKSFQSLSHCKKAIEGD
ncbi:prepilin-type cleavage/methylation domain-containing protein [[Haemophilus] felis]|nr:prepilin-type cleavage/methylation domain-containing protein [[Haemophilus] felis]NBI39981.1 prepilin-type cleavage/methylation domain-containing protein [[Haemophilus] felis]NBI41911.1 prepilin-type cleavage/methylation domain-containing protein [[Haemophilus] felis]